MSRRKKHTAESKVKIVREHLENKVSISELSERYGIHPNMIHKWKKELFEGALETFSKKHKKQNKQGSCHIHRDSDLFCFRPGVTSRLSMKVGQEQDCRDHGNQHDQNKFRQMRRNGKLIDGTGNPWFNADLGIKNGKIAKIGQVDEATKVIDVNGLVITPGFIDPHTHSDPHTGLHSRVGRSGPDDLRYVQVRGSGDDASAPRAVAEAGGLGCRAS